MKREIEIWRVRSNGQVRWSSVVLLLLFAGLLVLLNYFLLVRPGKALDSDFMTLWAGGRALIEGINPYDPKEWMSLFERYGSTWIPNARAPHPLWTLIFFVPLAWLPVNIAAALWQAVSEATLGSCLYLLVSQFGSGGIKPREFGILLIGAFAFRGAATTILNGQITMLLLLVVTLFLMLAKRGSGFWAGFTIAFVLLKPSPFILFAPLMGLWLLSRRQWRMMTGGLLGITLLALTSWAIRPNWLFGWMAVKAKTYVTYQTPTVWGLAYEMSHLEWLWVGLGITILITVSLGWIAVRNKHSDAFSFTSLAICGSLFIAPYAWAYEHALLLIPLLYIFLMVRESAWSNLIWVVLTLLLPWSLYGVAMIRDVDTISFFLPLAIGLTVLFLDLLRDYGSTTVLASNSPE
jgi:hypothetical protein